MAKSTARRPAKQTRHGAVKGAVKKGAARKGTVIASSAPRDAVRIVPLHYPKPTYTAEQLAAAKRAFGSGDLYDGQARVAPADAQLTYRGGPLLAKAQVYAVFWGNSWQNSTTAQALRTAMDGFFKDILVSPLMDQMGEYSVPGTSIGKGTYLGSSVRADGAPKGSVTDAAIRTRLRKWITAKVLPKTSANTLYFVFLEPGVVSIMGGSKSCQNFCGYHNAVGNVYYAVMPYPSCAGCLGGMTVLDALTGTSSHELCEAITDPVPGRGWYDDNNGEIGDICAWSFRKIGAHTVQLEWSNAQRRCI
jgi:hypothetical protein